MIDHTGLVVSDYTRSRAFYVGALAPLGYGLLAELPLAAGGRDNGAPGPRPHYHEDYYGAFVLDPDGHNIEAVCHEPALESG